MSSARTEQSCPLAVLSIDMDGPAEYAGIHGISNQAPGNPLYGAPLQRILKLTQESSFLCTLFVIGRDVSPNRSALRQAVDAGHELGNHSWSHDYRLRLRSPDTIKREIVQCHEALEKAADVHCVGYRAPGYQISSAQLDALEGLSYHYDSSVFPSPWYHGLKLGALAWYRVAGRRSSSMASEWSHLGAPRRPYTPGPDPFGQGTRGIVEIPIATSGGGGPTTLTALLLMPERIRRWMVRSMSRLPVVVINAHAMDFAAASDAGIDHTIASHQPELNIPIEQRIERVRDMMAQLALSHRLVRACDAAVKPNGA